MDARSPVRADHRFLRRMITVTLGGKLEHVPAEFEKVTRVFAKAGGSWERIFRGSPDDLNLIKRVLKVAFDKGYLTKKWIWK